MEGRSLKEHERDIAAVASIDVVPTILAAVCRATGMGFAAVARVTDERWIACSVRDEINFGLLVGDELKLETTICHEIRKSEQLVVISNVSSDPTYRDHHTPALYGFESYISVPIVLADGRFYGTLCAVDPHPRPIEAPEIIAIFKMFAKIIGQQLDTSDQLTAANTTISRHENERDLLWESSPDLLVELDFAGNILRINPAWTAILGFEREELLGRQVDTLVVPEDVEVTKQALADAVAGSPPTIENRYLHKDGSTRWFSWVAAPTERSVLATGRHITAQRRAEAALRDEQDFVRLALSAIGGVGVWTYDIPADRFSCDTSIAELYGLDPARISAGFTRDEFFANVHPDDRRALDKVLASGLKRCGELELEYRLLHPGGAVRWVLSRGHTYMDLQGRAVRRTGIGVDMTSQRQIEDQLRQSQKMEALGQLTGGIAHDFNNLLTVIRGSADLLRRANVDEERRQRYLDAIADTADRATRLTSQLLSFARRQALTPEVFDVGESLENVAKIVETLVGSRIVLDIDVSHCPCLINADRTQFDTAIVNIAANARDAMNGAGRLTISATPVDGIPAVRAHSPVAGRFIAVTLTDTGPGIPADRLDHVFEPFFTTKGVGQGTGLGLSQVFGFAKQSGGEVIARNEAHGGASLTLYLPLSNHAAAVPGESVNHEIALSGEGLCILVVEDNEEVGSFATGALDELGYQTKWVLSAAAALEALEARGDFDLVFSDVVMPGMSGIDLGREIQRLYPHLPVILTSGYSEAIVQSGASGFTLLSKPYTIASLSRVIQRARRRSGRWRS